MWLNLMCSSVFKGWLKNFFTHDLYKIYWVVPKYTKTGFNVLNISCITCVYTLLLLLANVQTENFLIIEYIFLVKGQGLFRHPNLDYIFIVGKASVNNDIFVVAPNKIHNRIECVWIECAVSLLRGI